MRAPLCLTTSVVWTIDADLRLQLQHVAQHKLRLTWITSAAISALWKLVLCQFQKRNSSFVYQNLSSQVGIYSSANKRPLCSLLTVPVNDVGYFHECYFKFIPLFDHVILCCFTISLWVLIQFFSRNWWDFHFVHHNRYLYLSLKNWQKKLKQFTINITSTHSYCQTWASLSSSLLLWYTNQTQRFGSYAQWRCIRINERRLSYSC